MSWLLDNNGDYVLDNAGNRIWVGESQAATPEYEIPTGLQVIAENRMTSVEASSENANYPDDNVLDEHPKKVWKAVDSVTTASLKCTFTGGCNTLAIFGSNASSITANIRDPNAISWPDFVSNIWVDVVWVYTPITTTIEMQQTGNSFAMWATFEYLEDTLTMDIIFNSSETVQAGVVVAGEALGFRNPDYGLTQGAVDYSIPKQMSNGAFWFKQRDVVRTFSGKMLLERDAEFYSFMNTVARVNSYSPMAWRVTDLDSFEWVVYARFTNQPQGTHAYPIHSSVDFSIIEVL